MSATADPARTLASEIAWWVFDLDNTLYPASCNLFDQVDRRIGAFIADTLSLPAPEARRLQKQYYRDHGTTLNGLMLWHGIDPTVYLDYVHRIDLAPITRQPVLDAALDRLPGRKLVYTNGSRAHADRVLDRLGIARHFDLVHDIAAAGYLPKPDPRPYRHLLDQAGIDARKACMIEDIARNLVPAARLGMTTVWLAGTGAWSQPSPQIAAEIHHRIDDLPGWLDRLTTP